MIIHSTLLSEINGHIREGNALVDFWAPWCGPCRAFGEIIEKELIPALPDLKVIKVNVDQCQDLAIRLGIQSIPSVFFYNNGRLITRFTGVAPVDQLIRLFRSCKSENEKQNEKEESHEEH